MKRSSFIRNIALLGAGASLTPWKLAANGVTTHRVDLPPASVHIPHGNFAEATETWVRIPEMDLEISTETFMRYGHEASDCDLNLISVRRANESVLISFGENGTEAVGHIQGVSVKENRIIGSHHSLTIDIEAGYLSLSRA